MNPVNVLVFFLLASMLGWVIDSLYRSVVDGRWVNAGYFVGPICPIYGLGALLLLAVIPLVAPYPLPARLGLYFVVFSVFEFLGGLFTVHVLRTRLWDYSDSRFNVMGHVDLKHSGYWVLLAFSFEKSFWPLYIWMDSYSSKVGDTVGLALSFTGFTILLLAALRRLIRNRTRYRGAGNRKRVGRDGVKGQMELLEREYESLLEKVDDWVILPVEQPVEAWFVENERILLEIRGQMDGMRERMHRLGRFAQMHYQKRLLDGMARVMERRTDMVERLRRRMEDGGNESMEAALTEYVRRNRAVKERMRRQLSYGVRKLRAKIRTLRNGD